MSSHAGERTWEDFRVDQSPGTQRVAAAVDRLQPATAMFSLVTGNPQTSQPASRFCSADGLPLISELNQELRAERPAAGAEWDQPRIYTGTLVRLSGPAGQQNPLTWQRQRIHAWLWKRPRQPLKGLSHSPLYLTGNPSSQYTGPTGAEPPGRPLQNKRRDGGMKGRKEERTSCFCTFT